MSDFGAQQGNLSQSQALAAAIQRAKQIAAKIQPNQQPISSGGGGGGFKRQHEEADLGPENKRFTSPGESDYGQNNNSNMSSGSGGGGGGSNGGGSNSGAGGPNLSQALAQAAAVAARLAANAGTTCEEQVRIPETIVNAFMGRSGSDTISHIQAESGCKIQLSQDQERVITLRGSRETVSKGREMLQQLANRQGGDSVEVILTINLPPPGPSGYPPYQEIMIPGAKVGLVIGKGGDTIKQLQEKTGAKMVIIQDGPNQELIKPLRISGEAQKIEHAKQLVLELIAQKDAQAQGGRPNTGGGGGGGHPGLGFNNFNNGGGAPGGGESVEVFVPKIAVGVVIGKGGDMIRKIQTECGCKLQFIQGKNDEPGDRRCLIQGSRQQVEDAKRTIEGLIENVMQRNGAGRNGNGNAGGDSNNSNYGYGYGVNHVQQPGREEITFMVPASKCGIVIGRGGETIKLINQQSGAYTEMDRNAVNRPNEKLFKSKGTSEQVEAARQLIAEKISVELTVISRKPISGNGPPNQHHNQQQGVAPGYGQSPMGGGDPNAVAAAAAAYQQQPWNAYGQQAGWDQAQQQQMAMGQNPTAVAGAPPAAGQADYSAQWIEYYKSMGMHREAEMIEQQLKAKQASAAAAAAAAQPQPQPQPQQQPQQQQQAAGQQSAGDYSAQWAEYYRSIGKHEEAEAIEKQIKTKQNGGTNSAAIPVASAPANPGGAPGVLAPTGAQGGAGAYPQGMTPTQYAQYSQYYAAAAAAGQQQQQQQQHAGGPNAAAAAAAAAAGYAQQTYAGYGGYPGAPQPASSSGAGNVGPPKSHKNDKN